MEQQPLLTKNQLIDWLIYHVPIEDSNLSQRPFGLYHAGYNYVCENPWDLYDNFAEHIIYSDKPLHERITFHYWYWTIY